MHALAGEGSAGSGGARRHGGEAQAAARDLGHAAGGRSPSDTMRRARGGCWRRATSSSTAAIPTSRTMSAAPRRSSAKRIHYVDVGTSGGVWGLERGYLHDDRRRQGGGRPSRSDLRRARAGRRATFRRTPGREGRDPRVEQGYLHCGPAGAGHFVKMVHNGIEYGLMQAYAEGFDILRNAASKSLPDGPALRRSTSPTSPRCGGAAASSRRGCST